MKRVWVTTVLCGLFLFGCGAVSTQTSAPVVAVADGVGNVTGNVTGNSDTQGATIIHVGTDSVAESPADRAPNPETQNGAENTPSQPKPEPQQPSNGTTVTPPSQATKPTPPPAKTPPQVNYWNSLPALADKGKTVVLTFDDGPSPWTAKLIQTLDDEDVPAIMFWNTYHIQFATDEVTSMLRQSPNIAVGDHTVDHPDLLQLGYAAQKREIVDAKDVIEKTVGAPVLFFRPPYGNYNQTTEQILSETNLQCVMWNDDSLDWKYPNNEKAVMNQIRSELHPGAVILMHDHQDTIRELPDIIAMLRKAGYSFTTFAALQKSAP